MATREDDVAFGLVALFPTVIVPDDSGGTEAVEEAFTEVEGVGRERRPHLTSSVSSGPPRSR